MGPCLSRNKGIDEDMLVLRDAKLPIIWVLGGPGSGKATQCGKLADAYGFKNLSTGDLLRAEAMSGSPLGKSINESMMKGQLVSREVVLDIIKKAMLKDVAQSRGFVIGGFPRALKQAQDFENKITPCSLILYLKCSDETMKERLMNRAKTSSARNDDSEAVIKKRLETFYSTSEPVIQKYMAKVAIIDASGDIDNTFQQCKEKVDALLMETEKDLNKAPSEVDTSAAPVEAPAE